MALTGYSAFAVADICAKWLMQYYTVSQVICVENVLAVILLIILSPLLGGMKGTFRGKNLKINLFRAALNFTLAMILNYSYKIFPLADVYTMIFTKPFMIALLAFWFFRERASRTQWLAIIAGFTGVMIAMRPGTEGFDPMLFLPLTATAMIALLFFTARFLDRPSAFSAGFFPTLGVAVLGREHRGHEEGLHDAPEDEEQERVRERVEAIVVRDRARPNGPRADEQRQQVEEHHGTGEGDDVIRQPAIEARHPRRLGSNLAQDVLGMDDWITERS